MLKVTGLEVEIQNSEILRGVSFDVAAGELVCLVGRNGAGKTTTLRTIMGYLRQRAGTIRLAGVDLAGKSTLQRARMGLGYSPEDSEVLGELTVAESQRDSPQMSKAVATASTATPARTSRTRPGFPIWVPLSATRACDKLLLAPVLSSSGATTIVSPPGSGFGWGSRS